MGWASGEAAVPALPRRLLPVQGLGRFGRRQAFQQSEVAGAVGHLMADDGVQVDRVAWADDAAEEVLQGSDGWAVVAGDGLSVDDELGQPGAPGAPEALDGAELPHAAHPPSWRRAVL